ncbi:MAG: hypothetical protein IKQ60_08865 [Candidatus Methanomethylophilaceae archaeon]|nr:hypothetical protein [Candidatus Methanomethylophilaceae archaeon]
MLNNDDFTAVFKKKVNDYFLGIVIGSHWEYSAPMSVSIIQDIKANPCSLTIYGNGDDGNYDADDHIIEYMPYCTKRFAQGGHDTLNTYGFYKNGCHIAGFSADPYATAPTYLNGQDYKINNDAVLYCIWEPDR